MSDSLRIAVIGLSCRVPGAANPSEFWTLLREGREGLRRFTDAALEAAGVDADVRRRPEYVPVTGALDGIEMFDAAFFGVPPREAQILDPQHRVFLELAWEALEDAGYAAEDGNRRIGVYAGTGLSTYLLNNLLSRGDLHRYAAPLQVLMANNKDYLPTRASYRLNLRGPSLNLNTACSTSLVAVHVACQALLAHECDVALAGGVGIQVPQDRGYLYEPEGILSPDGHCRPFDATAGGTVSGNGGGIVVLRRLEDAEADGDDIRAVILATAINNDGAGKAGFTAPSVTGQAEVIGEALAAAGVDASTIQYVETHGTGTAVGDPIEIAALAHAFARVDRRTHRCAIGSVKSNVGHLDEGAGVAGLIKTVLALQHREIPPSLNFERPNPACRFEDTPFHVNSALTPWPANDGPRRAAVSSFGIGGTNAHAVLEEAPPRASAPPRRPVSLLTLSARTPAALRRVEASLRAALQQQPGLPLADVAHTLQRGRRRFACRRALAARDAGDAIRQLQSARERMTTGGARPVVFMFPGQGSQHVGMARELYDIEPVFRSMFDRVADAVIAATGPDVRRAIYDPLPGATSIDETIVAQPALLAIELALHALWRQWGIVPAAMIGHSTGECVAHAAAGMLSVDEAVRLIVRRSAAMQAMPRGAMAAVALDEAALRRHIAACGGRVAIATINSPGGSVISGTVDEVHALAARLSARDVQVRPIRAAQAFHSPMMAPAAAAVAGVVPARRPGSTPVISNVTGTWVTERELPDTGYWGRHLVETVRFADGIRTILARHPDALFVEVGPGRALAAHVRHFTPDPVLSSLPHLDDPSNDHQVLLRSLGELWEHGATVDWDGFAESDRRPRVALPTYPFERQRYWLDAPRVASQQAPARTPPDVERWLYEPCWSPAPAPGASSLSRVVLFTPTGRRAGADALRALVGAASADAVFVEPGDAFAAVDERTFRVRPGDADDYTALLGSMSARGSGPITCVHAWLIDAPSHSDDDCLALGVHSLMCLLRAAAAHSRVDAVSVVTTGAVAVDSLERPRPEVAAVTGLLRAAAVEQPALRLRHVDLDEEAAFDAPGLLADLSAAADAGPSVAYRGSSRYEPTIRTHSSTRGDSYRVQPGSAWLITGGFGSMGMAFADWLTRQAPVTVALLGRSAPSPDTRQALAELERRGARVLAAQVDVTDRSAVHEFVTRLRVTAGPIVGVIHTAGTIGRGLLEDKPFAELRRVLAPKLDGAKHLADALADAPPQVFVVCSSLASRFPVAGQGDYAAANAALDAFVHAYRRDTGVRAISIGWGFWQDLGMIRKSAMPPADQDRIVREIRDNGWETAGVEAFAAILQRCDAPEVLVSPTPPAATIARRAHPLLAARDDRSGYTSYTIGFDRAMRWMLDEHRVGGRAVLPGTAYLEMARAAYADRHGASRIEIRDVYFIEPYFGNTGELRLVLQHRDDHDDFVVISAAGPDRWRTHVRGELHALTAEAPPPMPIAPAELGAVPPALAERMSGFGPHWPDLESMAVIDDRAIAVVALQERFAHETGSLALHPALLDNATGFFPIARQTMARVPFSYRSIRIYGPLPARVLSHARARGRAGDAAEFFDVTIGTPAGEVVLVATGYTLRLLPAPAPAAGSNDDNAALAIATRGVLDSLRYSPVGRPAPGPGEVEIQVEASGINFIEVLYALGMLPARPDGVFPFGLECAGIVSRVGPGVPEFAPGQRVAAFTNGTDRLFALARAATVAPLPADMSFEDAATIPAAYMTAYTALVDQGRLRPGERVLIHSACGGVGLAAVAIARAIGATVFATAGTGGKREYLRGLGITHVMDSRSAAFVEQTRAATGGEGVHVVLNSLAGEFIEHGLSVLAPGGRFLELGKRDILEGRALSLDHFRRRLSFIAIDVGPDLPGFSTLWRQVWSHVASGDYPPLPHQTYPAHDAAAAFAEFARGRHIGRFVLSFADRGAVHQQALAAPSEEGRPLAEILGLDVEPAHAEDLQGDVEQLIGRIWQDLLGTPALGRDDNFFALNGDSLLGAQVIARLHRATGIKVPLSALFKHPTVAGLAAVVRDLQQPQPPLAAAVATADQDMDEGII